MILLIIGLWVWNGKVAFMVFIMIVSMLFIFLYVRIKVPKWFGGITGDVVGASGQGLEVMLWMITWLLHYYVMGLLWKMNVLPILVVPILRSANRDAPSYKR